MACPFLGCVHICLINNNYCLPIVRVLPTHKSNILTTKEQQVLHKGHKLKKDKGERKFKAKG